MGEGGTVMRIVILGAGVVGSVMGAHLAQGGAEVICIARGQRAQQLQEQGIRVTGLANITAPVHVIMHPHKVQDADVSVVAVTTYNTEAVLRSVSHLAVGHALSIQNGVFKHEQVARYFGWDKTLGAVAGHAGEVLPDGAVRCTINGSLVIGKLPDGTSEQVQALATAFTRTGLRTEVAPHIQTNEWSKYVVFVGLMAVAVLTRLETYKMLKDPALASVGVMLQREMARLAAKLAIPLEDYGELMRAKTVTSSALEEAVVSLRQAGEHLEARGGVAH